MILSRGPGVLFLTLGIILVLHYSSAEDNLVFPYGRESELFDYLTNSSRYDSRSRPLNYDVLEVKNSVFVYFLGNIRAQQLEFEAHLLIRQKWQDKKLSFANVSTNIEYMEGETWFADHIWTPNIFIENEVNSDLMTMTRDSVYIRIQSNGIVNYHYRIRTVVLCDMNLQRFPHDTQVCSILLESWTHPINEVVLRWESVFPLARNNFTQPEYYISAMNTKETVSVYIEQGITPRLEMLDNEGRKIIRKTHHQLQGRKPSGNYSALEIEFHLTRQIGHYVIDYYVPSALLVTLSWISFWLDPNAVPGRVTLGTATWLSFITMTKTTGSDQLPRVSYIKFLDIWFLSCTVFIFASLLEFALVNIIWRRKEHVTMSRITGKEILLEGFKELGRSALTTPSFTRRNSQAEQESRLGSENRRNSAPSAQSRKVSTLSLNELAVNLPSFNFQSANNISNNNNSFSNNNINNKNRSLSTSSSPYSEPFQFYVSEPDPDMQEVILPVPSFPQEGEKRTGKVLWGNAANALIRKRRNNRTTVTDEEDGKEKDEPVNIMEQFQSMSYEEIAIWIDTKARMVFPLMFLLFVIMYSIFVVYADLLPSSTAMVHA